MSGTMNIGNSLANIKVPALVLKADANEDVRKSNEEVAKVIQSGKLTILKVADTICTLIN